MNKKSQAVVKQIPEFLQIMEASLRSGYSLSQSLEIVTKDMNGQLASKFQFLSQLLPNLKRVT